MSIGPIITLIAVAAALACAGVACWLRFRRDNDPRR
jgi:hypothetical protein